VTLATSKYALFVGIPAVGHLNPLLVQARELRLRGWRVALASTDEVQAHVERAGVDFVSLGPKPRRKETDAQLEVMVSAEPRALKSSIMLLSAVNSVWSTMYDGLRARISDDRPDVLVVDLVTMAGVDAARASGIPYVLNNPDLLPLIPPSALPPAPNVPLLGSGRSIQRLSWLDRRAGPVFQRFAAAVLELVSGWQLKAQRQARQLPWKPPRLGRSTLIMVDSAFGLEYRRALPPSVEMVGPMIDPDLPPLPQELRCWLDAGPPVVFVNLGTIARPGREFLARLVRGLSSQPARVLWAIREPLRELLPPTLPDNIRFGSWITSQVAVLAHANVRLFVSHCGINSVNESLSCKTPIVGIPLFADQFDMAARVHDAGVGLVLDKARFTPAQLADRVERVLTGSSFMANTMALQPGFAAAGGVKRAADLIERVAAA
jgi:UDP:flavonoid glycosyltransferase YjiC (YdhE family)